MKWGIIIIGIILSALFGFGGILFGVVGIFFGVVVACVVAVAISHENRIESIKIGLISSCIGGIVFSFLTNDVEVALGILIIFVIAGAIGGLIGNILWGDNPQLVSN